MTPSFWWQDVRHAARFLGRHRLFAVGVILVLAIGIGPVAALVSLMNVAFFRPWPVPEPERMVILRPRAAVGEVSGAISTAEYRFLRQHSRVLSYIAASRLASVNVDAGVGQPLRLFAEPVSGDYFDALRAGMTVGRGFVPDEEDYGAPKAVAIISHHLWRTHFGSDPAIIGRTVRFGQQPFVLVGVVRRGFVGADARGGRRTDVWMPLPAAALLYGASPDLDQFSNPRGAGPGLLFGRLRPDATPSSAEAELSALSRQFRAAAGLPSAGIEAIDTRPLSRWSSSFIRSMLPVQALLGVAVVLVLILSCLNAGNLLLARAISRRREIGIHVALGASRPRVVRQLLIEAAMLSTLAGALGLGLAFAVPRIMVALGFGYSGDGFYRLSSPNSVEVSYFAPDALTFWVAAALMSLTAVLAGLAPALQASRDTLSVLSAERLGSTSGARWRSGLLVAQIAVTTVLLVGAGLLTRAVDHAGALEPGFAIRDVRVISVQTRIPPDMSTRSKAFFVGLRDALQNTNLGAVAVADEPPFWDMNLVMSVRRPESPETVQSVLLRRVSREYFRVLGIPIVAGRAPDRDTDSDELVVNEAAARLLWAGADPIGRAIDSAISRTEFQRYTVVGVAKNVPVRSMSEIEPVIYRTPDWWSANGVATFFVRGGPPGASQQVRAVAARLEPEVTVTERPMVDYVRASLTTAVLASRVAWAIGALALVLAMVGAFGVFAQAAAARRREIGIRMALGASRGQIASLVLVLASRAVVWGVGAGFLLSVLGVPVLRRFLYGLDPFDPVAYIGVAGVLTLCAGAATWIPIRRALVVDPASTLRAE